MLTEEVVVAAKDSRNLFLRDNNGERQSVLSEKSVADLLKIAAAAIRRIWYILRMKKPFLANLRQANQKGPPFHRQDRANT